VTQVSRRQFVQGGFAIACLSLLAGCGVVPLPWQRASAGSKVPRIGYLTTVTTPPAEIQAFRDGLLELAYQEGENITLVVGIAESIEQIPDRAAELVALPVDLLMTSGAAGDTQAAMDATRTIPIVFAAAPDPVRTGFVASLARPGGNLTGLSTLAPQASGKRLQLLREVMPGISRVIFISPTAGAEATGILPEARLAAQSLGIQILVPNISTVADLPEAFQMAIAERAEAIWMSSSPLLSSEVTRIMEFAMAERLPVLSQTRIFADDGGLIYYGSNRLAQFRRAATYVDRILRGANPADMPVEQPTEFELVINLKSAQALGLTIPQSVLAQATEVIQ
jgi:putative ABC transport system substrate-binding protein